MTVSSPEVLKVGTDRSLVETLGTARAAPGAWPKAVS